MISCSTMRSCALYLGLWSTIAVRAQASTDVGPILSSQQIQGPEFVGTPAPGSPLKPKVVFEPPSVLMHGDTGNSGTTDENGPLGNAVRNSSAAHTLVGAMYWGKGGTLTGGVVQLPVTATPRLGIAAFDPATLKPLVNWFAPGENESIAPTYTQLRLKDSVMVLKSSLNRIYIVQRVDDCGTPRFETLRTIDVTEYLDPNEELLGAMFDSTDNIWFTSGALGKVSNSNTTSTTIGYITPDGDVHTMKIPSQIIENSIAINGTDVFVVTGPPAQSSSPTGYVFGLTANRQAKSVDVLWNTTCDAGTHKKPGGFGRGCGSSPSVMGRDYIALTDNADDQINLMVIRQEKAARNEDQVFCKIPLFRKGASGNDIRATTHYDGENHSVTVVNTYNGPPLIDQLGGMSPNGPNNSMTDMPGGVTQIKVTPNGCVVNWNNDLVIKAVPVLSTGSGIFYGYVQDIDLAKKGEYVWYVVAMDWVTGKVLWKARTGAGESYNDNFAPMAVHEGRVYQSVAGGVVWISDERH